MPTLDLQSNAPTALPRLGIIRLGTSEQRTSAKGKEYKKPSESPFFVLADAPAVAAAYGDQPAELLIYLPFATLDENMSTWHELWRGGICACRGDGQRVKSLISDDMSQRLVRDYQPHTPCPGMAHDLYERCADCKPHLTLMVMVRKPSDQFQLVDGFGYYQIRSSSSINITNLTGQLRYIEQFQARRGATLQGVPMKLRRIQREFNYTDKADGKIKTTRKWLLDLEFDKEWSHAAEQAMHVLGMGGAVLALPQPVDTVTGEIIDENEFEPLPEAPPPARSEAAGKRNGSSVDDHSPNLPIDPQKRLCDFTPAEMTMFKPYIDKRYNTRQSSLRDLFYQVTGFKKAEECDWTFADVLKALDEHMQIERVQT